MNKAFDKSPVPGHTLPQEYYASPEIYERDIRLLGQTQWLMVDHESRVRKPGYYFLFEFGSESVIIVRDKQNRIRAHYNVCRHRGSRICLHPSGNARAFTCPYHAWTYDLDGSLRSAMYMPEGLDRAQNGLVPCHAEVLEGIIFVNLSSAEPPSFETFAERVGPYLRRHNLARAKVAVRRLIPNAANWKLVVENFLECYHCRASPSSPLFDS
jgi:phenylpropionate dioxygenase-like ring-hydroxylating dioxygenase large terminal subunit